MPTKKNISTVWPTATAVHKSEIQYPFLYKPDLHTSFPEYFKDFQYFHFRVAELSGTYTQLAAQTFRNIAGNVTSQEVCLRWLDFSPYGINIFPRWSEGFIGSQRGKALADLSLVFKSQFLSFCTKVKKTSPPTFYTFYY